MDYLPQAESTYKALQPFESVDAMNDAIKAHKRAHELSQTDRDVLDVISRYACKFAGVAYLSKENIAKAAGYKSRRTATRSCKRLEELGIIEQYTTKRVTGDRRQSSNIIVIKAINTEEVTPESHAKEAPAKAIKTSSSNTYKETIQTSKPSTDEIIKRGLKHVIHSPIYEALAPFFSGQALYDTVGTLYRAKASVDRSITLEDYTDDYIDAFMNVVRKYKRGEVRSLSGLLYAAWQNVTAEIWRRRKEAEEGISKYYDWLTVE